MIQDFKFAFRQLIKTPGFTTIAILTLAIAIGVNSAVFALVNGVILRPVVPLRPAEVVNVFTARQGAAHDYRPFSYNEFSALRENNDVFTDVGAMAFALAGIGRDEGMRRSFVFLTSSNFFSLMGVKPVVGRFYNEAECRPDANVPVVVASYAYWKKLGGRTDLIGKPLTVNGQTYTLIGVTPDGFSGGNALLAPDLWLPLGVYVQLGSAFSDTSGKMELSAPKNYTLNLIARMRPGLTIEATKARLPALAKRLTAIQPPDSTGARELQIQTPSRFSISTSPSDDGPVGLIGTLLLAMAAAVLLIACLNLANLLVARGHARQRELAIRSTLGGGRGRLTRQLLTEGLLLAFAGGTVALFLSQWATDTLAASLRPVLPVAVNLPDLDLDWRVLVGTVACSLIATLVFGVWPAWSLTGRAAATDLKRRINEDARRFGSMKVGNALVIGQVALSVLLLACGGLFLMSAISTATADPGFRLEGGLLVEIDPSLAGYDETRSRQSELALVDNREICRDSRISEVPIRRA